MRVQYDVMVQEFARVLEKKGFTHEDAENAAIIFAQNSLAGVYSHGLNRFPRVVSYLEKGEIDPNARATCEMKMGAIERWDGHRGFGPLNAKRAMDRACELAKENGIGCVALGNNNHWMRGGTYGWLAADHGCIGICWSNTMPNMPAWGGLNRKIGNNPLIMAVPRSNGEHAMIDCAVSQFSYGKIEDCLSIRKLRNCTVNHRMFTIGTRHCHDQRVVSYFTVQAAPCRHVRHCVGPADTDTSMICCEPSICTASHPVVIVS